MYFLMYTIGDDSKPFTPPSQKEMEEMDKFMDEAVKAGWLLATGALMPTAQGTTVKFADGKFTVNEGHYDGYKELIGGWALVKTGSKAEAIDLTKRFLRLVGGGESRIREVTVPEQVLLHHA
jgi:hypothetical protein